MQVDRADIERKLLGALVADPDASTTLINRVVRRYLEVRDTTYEDRRTDRLLATAARPVSETTVEFSCPTCGDRYRYNTDRQVSCAVVHRGGCCHYGQEKLTALGPLPVSTHQIGAPMQNQDGGEPRVTEGGGHG